MVKLGTFNDILSNGSKEDRISVGFSITPHRDISVHRFIGYGISPEEQINKLECEFSFSATGAKKDLLQLQPKLETLNLKVSRTDSKSEQQESEIVITRNEATLDSKIKKYRLNQEQLSSHEILALEYDVIKPKRPSQIRKLSDVRSEKIGEFAGATLYHFLPLSMSLAYDIIEDKKRTIIDMMTNPRLYRENKLIDDLDDNNSSFKNHILDLIDEIIKEFKGSERVLERVKEAIDKLKNEFSYANIRVFLTIPIFQQLYTQSIVENKDQLKNLLDFGSTSQIGLETQSNYFYDVMEFVDFFCRRAVKYLGPLRDEPKPIYPLIGSADPSDIGLKGENTASVFDIHKETVIEYIHPSSFGSDLENVKTVTGTLEKAVFEWLGYMGVAENVSTSDKGKLGHEMKIITQGSLSDHDLTHVGVGVSQVLPILVLSLLADEDSCLIFEQPELHLHPKVQTRLADFFSSMIYLKKQCIVESHSEYLINRLRYLIAISNKDELSSKINIYFVEKDQDKSIYNKVIINRYGTITNWPKGFFDENEKNASSIIRAAMEKKRKDELPRNNNG